MRCVLQAERTRLKGSSRWRGGDGGEGKQKGGDVSDEGLTSEEEVSGSGEGEEEGSDESGVSHGSEAERVDEESGDEDSGDEKEDVLKVSFSRIVFIICEATMLSCVSLASYTGSC